MVKITGKKRSIRKRQTKKKGGSYCVFENEHKYRPALYDTDDAQTRCSHCPVCTQPRFYFYFFCNNTLFSYKPHVFKHLDTFNRATQPNENICTSTRDGKKRIYFSTTYHNLQGNLLNLIREFNNIIKVNELSYIKLKPPNSTANESADPIYYTYILPDTDITIFWMNRPKPRTCPANIRDNDYKNSLHCIQITHIHYGQHYLSPKCTYNTANKNQFFNASTVPDITFDNNVVSLSPSAEEMLENTRKRLEGKETAEAVKEKEELEIAMYLNMQEEAQKINSEQKLESEPLIETNADRKNDTLAAKKDTLKTQQKQQKHDSAIAKQKSLNKKKKKTTEKKDGKKKKNKKKKKT